MQATDWVAKGTYIYRNEVSRLEEVHRQRGGRAGWDADGLVHQG